MPHDQPLKTTQQMLQAKAQAPTEDVSDHSDEDLTALYEAQSGLPADDPLKQKDQGIAAAQANLVADNSRSASNGEAGLSPKALAEFRANGNTTSVIHVADTAQPVAPHITAAVETRGNGAIVVDPNKRVPVPSMVGSDLRDAVIAAGRLGLRLEPVGSGLAKEQVPAAGTMVPVGTQIVVRFTR